MSFGYHYITMEPQQDTKHDDQAESAPGTGRLDTTSRILSHAQLNNATTGESLRLWETVLHLAVSQRGH